jgi:signal transduction histidine kinase
MTEIRPQLRGLMFKLALFYVLLSLPALILVESTILILEFQRFMHDVDGGLLARATTGAADEIAERWSGSNAADEAGTWLESWVLRLERPREGLSAEDSYILLELSGEPLAAALLAPDGQVVVRSPATTRWALQLPDAGERADAARETASLPGSQSPYRIRRTLAPVRGADGSLRGYLFVELRLPLPWRRFLLDSSFEWPIVLAYLIVFGLASSFFLATWVTRRLNRVARAAIAWSRGDFSDRIGDPSRDELGRLSAVLDRMALDLKGLLRSRSQLATLAERQRLARDLHDTIKQKAFALNLQLAAARRQLGATAATDRLDLAQHLTHQIQQELAQILDEMQASDTELPFAERVRVRASDWAHTSGVTPQFALDDMPPMTPTDEDSLLRILDEALANVLRHSDADQVTISLRREADRVRLAITDNGRGIAADARAGMGLGNMRDRAQALNDGRFEIIADPGQGTTVSLSFVPDPTSTA